MVRTALGTRLASSRLCHPMGTSTLLGPAAGQSGHSLPVSHHCAAPAPEARDSVFRYIGLVERLRLVTVDRGNKGPV